MTTNIQRMQRFTCDHYPTPFLDTFGGRSVIVATDGYRLMVEEASAPGVGLPPPPRVPDWQPAVPKARADVVLLAAKTATAMLLRAQRANDAQYKTQLAEWKAATKVASQAVRDAEKAQKKARTPEARARAADTLRVLKNELAYHGPEPKPRGVTVKNGKIDGELFWADTTERHFNPRYLREGLLALRQGQAEDAVRVTLGEPHEAMRFDLGERFYVLMPMGRS